MPKRQDRRRNRRQSLFASRTANRRRIRWCRRTNGRPRPSRPTRFHPSHRQYSRGTWSHRRLTRSEWPFPRRVQRRGAHLSRFWAESATPVPESGLARPGAAKGLGGLETRFRRPRVISLRAQPTAEWPCRTWRGDDAPGCAGVPVDDRAWLRAEIIVGENFSGDFCGLGDVRYGMRKGGGSLPSGASTSDNAISGNRGPAAGHGGRRWLNLALPRRQLGHGAAPRL